MPAPASGILLCDKPEGISSQAAVTRIKRILGAKAAGHTGTLDPMAGGLLLICFGRATRACEYLTGADKKYLAVLKTGILTDTLDITGKTLETAGKKVGRAEILSVLPRFRGEISQIPPVYSALKVKGKAMYKLARQGAAIEPEPRNVRISELELLSADEENGLFTLNVSCSKGTYIRSLCRDIAAAAGSLGAMAALRRTAIGEYEVSDALTIDEVESRAREGDFSFILGTDSAFLDLDAVHIDRRGEALWKNGVLVPGERIARGAAAAGQRLRVYGGDGAFLAVGRFDGEKFSSEKNFFEV